MDTVSLRSWTLAAARDGQHTRNDDLVRALCRQARERPEQRAFVHLGDDGAEQATVTFAELDRQARTIAARLQELGLAGERVLLAFPSGLDFIAAYFGCLYAGSVAVPVPLPHRRTVDRFHDVAADAGARLVLSTRAIRTRVEAVAESIDLRRHRAPGAINFEPRVQWLAVDEIGAGEDTGPFAAPAFRWAMPDLTPETLAMLQYTSGSTSRPKGVMITHGNLIESTRDIHRAFAMGRETSVFWLPTHHDMGLIGGVLEPVFAGTTCILMAPTTFLQRPLAWLDAISRYRATITGAPNFAFDLCVRKATDEDRVALDLSCLSLAFVGAEPVRADTLDRFAAAFAPCGFDPAAFYPCYGLAEATLMVSGAMRGRGATVRAFDEAALMSNQVIPVADGAAGSRRLVSSGTPVGDLRVMVVDSSGGQAVPAGESGEIWLAGRSVGTGYWGRTEMTREVFGAHLRDAVGGPKSGPFLRTGDLGFLVDGELYVTGRIDDLLIVRGANHHPQDLEATARESHPLLESGFGAVFAVEDPERGPRLVLVHDVIRTRDLDLTPALDAIRAAVLDRHGLSLHTVVLVRAGTLPRTSSGKIQRRACRSAYLAGHLKVLAESCWETIRDHPLEPVRTPGRESTLDVPASTSQFAAIPSRVLGTVCQHALAIGGEALSHVTPETRLANLGMDSLQRVELVALLEKSFACRLPDADFGPERTLGEVALAVQRQLDRRSNTVLPTSPTPREHRDFTHFPEYRELKRYERMLLDVASVNPYFRVDEGGGTSAIVRRIAGRDLVTFSDYDYLGLSHDPEVAAATKAAIDRYGTSAGASRLVAGEKQIHRDLERSLADFVGTAAALVFVSGHATNVTTIGHLMGAEDLIVHDALAHNSIMQGAQLSGATRRVFAHNNWRALDALLAEVRHRYRRVLIAIEGVYSMDGDVPDLPRFIDVKRKHGALLLVDEAHSLGVLGATGRGIGEHWNIARADVDVWMGTLSKSLASSGGFIAGSTALIEYLSYTAPGFVYSVGLSPPSAAAALAALTVLKEQPQRVARLRQSAALFLALATRRGLHTGSAAGTPVIPVIVGGSVKSLRLANALFGRGIFVQPILPPVVPEHSARLRFFITTSHSEQQLHDAVNAIAEELSLL